MKRKNQYSSVMILIRNAQMIARNGSNASNASDGTLKRQHLIMIEKQLKALNVNILESLAVRNAFKKQILFFLVAFCPIKPSYRTGPIRCMLFVRCKHIVYYVR